MLRVLVVDDSPVARDLIVEILDGDPEIQVVGTASNGQEAIARVAELKPDVVTMDVQMPVLDGFQATREIMSTAPTPIVVVSGSMSKPDIEKSMQSLEAGALIVIGKPPAPTSARFQQSVAELRSVVKSMAAVAVVRVRATRPITPELPPEESFVSLRPPGPPPRVVVVATSTGGPHALRTMLGDLPADFPIPVGIVQHISDGFTAGLVEWLDDSVPLEVRLAENGMPLKKGRIVVAPEGTHLEVGAGGVWELTDRPPIGSFRPSGTALFESAARTYGADVLAVIMTGMGDDGLAGMRSVRQRGGRILAQHPDTCTVDGMPGAAIAANLPDAIVPLNELGSVIADLARDSSDA